MVNPRQRSKRRSGSFRPTQHSKRAKKNLKKQPPIRGPKVLQDAWDKHKTVKQNYDALGLVATLKPNESGGTELFVDGSLEDETIPSTSTRGDPKGVAELSSGAKIRAGFGRILRDEQGNAVDIEFGDEDDGTLDTDRNVGTMDAYVDEKSVSTWTQLGNRAATRTKRPNSVVQELEKISGGDTEKKAPRFPSEGEVGYLKRLVGKHGENLEAMSRDRKLNPDQRTIGELMRLMKKAGGFEKFAE